MGSTVLAEKLYKIKLVTVRQIPFNSAKRGRVICLKAYL